MKNFCGKYRAILFRSGNAAMDVFIQMSMPVAPAMAHSPPLADSETLLGFAVAIPLEPDPEAGILTADRYRP